MIAVPMPSIGPSCSAPDPTLGIDSTGVGTLKLSGAGTVLNAAVVAALGSLSGLRDPTAVQAALDAMKVAGIAMGIINAIQQFANGLGGGGGNNSSQHEPGAQR